MPQGRDYVPALLSLSKPSEKEERAEFPWPQPQKSSKKQSLSKKCPENGAFLGEKGGNFAKDRSLARHGFK